MIQGVHAMFYTRHADELRAFFRDKLGLPAMDVGDGWLIFDLPQGDLGVHPTGAEIELHNRHDISFFCRDIEATMAELSARGVAFSGPIEDHGYGLVTWILAPGDLRIQLYQPRYRA